MAAHQLERMQEFEPDIESISAYLERLQMFFEVNDIAAEKKVQCYSVISKQNFSLLQNLVTPATPKDESFDDLTTFLKTHFEPKKLVIAERFNLYRRNQHDGESLMDFVADLRRLTLNCEFEIFLNQAFRDRFVCWLKRESTQKRLLSEDKKFTFSRAVEIA